MCIKVLQDKHHMIRGRVVDPKRALARGGKEAERKIFVGGLDPDMTEEEVKTFFTRYGKVQFILYKDYRMCMIFCSFMYKLIIL